MIKIVILVITALLSAFAVVLGFAPYFDYDDVFSRLYMVVVVNIILTTIVLGVVVNGLVSA